jgi:hypothetical protein
VSEIRCINIGRKRMDACPTRRCITRKKKMKRLMEKL